MLQWFAERIEHLATDASLRDPAWVACVKSLDADARRALLLRADRLATEGSLGRDRAGACYAALSHELDPSRADDLPRLRALLQTTPGGSRDLEPLWCAVSAKGPPDLAAQAAGLLGAIAMRRGSREAADRLYRAGLARALPLGGEAAVSLNVSCAQFATQTGRDLEAGAFARRARALFAPSTPPWHRASLGVVEAGIAARFEDWPRHAAAERALLEALPGCRPHHRRRLAPELAVLRLQRALGGGDGQVALEALEESALAWEQLGPMHETIFACWASNGVRARVLCGRADEALEHGRKALEHFAAEDDRALMLQIEVLAAAVARGVRGDDPALGLERLTERLAAASSDGLWAGERLQLALRLAERLTEGNEAGNPPLRLYDVAAGLALDRLAELAAFSLEFPDMLHLEPPDLESHEVQRARLLRKHWPMPAAIARHLIEGGGAVPGRVHTAAALLDLADAHLGVCAWCHRLRLADGRWLPVSTFLPLAPAQGLRLTHCICDGCAPGMKPA